MMLGSLGFAGAWAIPSLAASAASIKSASIKSTIDTAKTFPAISPYIYGGFIEHIGNLINHSLWSEVFDDRKFYYGVQEAEEPFPTDRRAAMAYIRKWTAVGPLNAITLDKANAYVGKHSPSIKLGDSPRGVAQSRLAFKGGKRYTGRIVLSSDEDTEVSITLMSSANKSNRQTIKIKSTKDWSTVSFEIEPKITTTDARIEITATGLGNLRLGAISLMPADNIKGFRADTLALMREMDCKILRMPGGNFISAYDWKNTIGPMDKRPPVLDPVWKAVQPNDVGVDELLQLCELIGCEPYWCVNTGYGEPRSGAELVEYVNGAANTTWGAKRAANGHAESYKVKYWNIGNEMYGHWQFGHMSRDQYTIKHNLFADAMRAVDPSIYIVAPGGFVDEMTTGQGIFIEGQPQVQVGSERDWAYGMLKDSWGKFDALATHAYPPEGKRFDLKTGKLFDVNMSLTEWARQPANRVATMTDAWEEYKKIFPELNKGKVKVFFDEWAYSFQDSYKGALAIALTLHEFFRHTDFIDMAGYTMATAWINSDAIDSVISAKGRVFQLYNKYFGTIPVDVTGNSPQPAPQYPVGGDQPRVNTGSATYPLDVMAALTSDGNSLTVAVVNTTDDVQNLDLLLEGFAANPKGKAWSLIGKNIDATNAVGKKPDVLIKSSGFDASARNLKIAPLSVTIYCFSKAST
jgi:alpha-L-arabinofuranosidase